MRFIWDEAKNSGNRKKHGFDFEDAERIFEATFVVIPDVRKNYPEPRFNATRWIGQVLVILTYANVNDEVLRAISLRKASKRERTVYEKEVSF